MDIFFMPVGMLGANCYILSEPEAPECFMIDPGGEAHIIINRLDSLGIKPKYILITHGHPDHIEAIDELREAWPEARVMIHEGDMKTLTSIDRRFPTPQWAKEGAGGVDFYREGEEIRCGGMSLRPVFTPGHSPGGVCLINDEENCAFTGDTLFNGSVGRSDFPGGNYPDLEASIRQKLYRLPRDMKVFPGHGQDTTIGREMESNPFIREGS
ncbi:MAG: MBL fold metallo-hydrolase [Clostridiales bacterium]|nr:MBL fold metallo-hydrolase [Clostridiales bacterium]